MRVIFAIVFLFGSADWINIFAQINCADFVNAFKKKDTTQISRSFRKNLVNDSCTIRSIDLVINDIAKGNVSDFNLISLRLMHQHADGYVSEYLAESMNKIVNSVFRIFLRKSFKMERNSKHTGSIPLLVDSAPFLNQDISVFIKKYIFQLPASDYTFKKYLQTIVSQL